MRFLAPLHLPPPSAATNQETQSSPSVPLYLLVMPSPNTTEARDQLNHRVAQLTSEKASLRDEVGGVLARRWLR